MKILPCGDGALMLDCVDAVEARRWHAALKDQVPAVLGAATVLVRGRPAELRTLVAGTDLADVVAPQGREIVIEVVYDGPDLQTVADHCELTVDEVVQRHVASPWTVGFAGFAPGFAYLTSPDERLDVPRLARPRPRVAAGSVALAGRFSGIYPRASPGGWQLIGRTQARLWDLDRTDPVLLHPGDRVRFEAIRTGSQP